jgi:predicted CXXCH cytochrome family protein
MLNTGHDLSAGSTFGADTNSPGLCVFCHTPHQVGGSALDGVYPLWNHTLSANAAYGTYTSVTMNAVPLEVGGGTTVTNLCLSCHDGTVAVQNLGNPPNAATPVTVNAGGNVNAAGFITGTANVGTDLTNDHPVNFTYDTALAGADGELYDPAVEAATAALLFGGTVQCASCHDPHDNSFPPFLAADNTDSALCVTCHVK